ncbi:MAG TPA: hypothetical protein PL193_13115 [Xanthobacteraceae bacterium]|nr:hypothetical protein [Xanthobacteraceae bacterium]
MAGASSRGGAVRFEPRNPAWEERSREIFARQSFMRMMDPARPRRGGLLARCKCAMQGPAA